MSTFLGTQRQDPQALWHAECALDLSERLYSGDAHEVAVACNKLVLRYQRAGHLDKAIKLALRALEIDRKAGAPPETLASRLNTFAGMLDTADCNVSVRDRTRYLRAALRQHLAALQMCQGGTTNAGAGMGRRSGFGG